MYSQTPPRASGQSTDAPAVSPAPMLPTAAKRQPGTHLTSACHAIRNFRTAIAACRLAPVPKVAATLPASLANQGSFPGQPLPRFRGTAGLSATLPAQSVHPGFSVGACAPPKGLPVLHPLPCACMLSPVARRKPPALRSRPAGRYHTHLPPPKSSTPRRSS